MNIFSKPVRDERVDLPGVVIVEREGTKVVFLSIDSYVDDAAFAELKAHYKKQGYFVQVFTPEKPITN
jgi:hypothetical protein